MGRLKIKNKIFIVISLFAIILAGISSFTNSNVLTQAGIACQPVGSSTQMKEVDSDYEGIPGSEFAHRKWTVHELFKNSVGFTSFYGEGPGTWFYSEKINRGAHIDGWNEETQKKFEEARRLSCDFGGVDWIPNGFIWMSNVLVSLVGAIVKVLIGEDVLAETVTKIVGGDGRSDGLIGTFLSSFYMPLILLAVAIMVVTLIYKGLIQMRMREALSSLIWTLGAFLIGVALMLQPQLLASAPQKITSTITTCVIGALSGQNCFAGNVNTPDLLAESECISSVASSAVNDAEMITNSMNCTIWKSFVLDPWAEAQFGAPYSKLYTKNAPSGGEIWENLPEGQEDKYCISLGSTRSYKSSVTNGRVPTMNKAEDTVCNVALYHLFIKTKMKDTVNQSGNNYDSAGVMRSDDSGTYDSRWYNILIPMAQDESKWSIYSGQNSFANRLGSSILGLLAVTAASTVLLTLSLFGGAYKLIGLILMAFAPVFFLFAIEPTRGRKIFLGWLETLVSSFLKYFAITVLLVVALVMYAGLLSNIDSTMMSLVAIIILTVALHMYRKEIIDLIGASNMGGERLSNKVGDLGERIWKGTKEKTAATVGGAIGGAWGMDRTRRAKLKASKDTIKDLKDKLQNATTEEEKDFYKQELEREEEEMRKHGLLRGGAKSLAAGSVSGGWESTKRAFKRGTGVGANIFQQADRTSMEMSRRTEKDKDEAAKRREEFERLLEAQRENPENKKNANVELTGETEVELTEEEIERNVIVSALRDSQRDPIKYKDKDKLTDEEINALDKFADKLINEASDEDLVELANDSEILNDENKRELVANEINARIRANSMMGISSGILSRTPLTNNENLSNDELRLNFDVTLEDYMETGDMDSLNKAISFAKTIAERNGESFNVDEYKEQFKVMREKRNDVGFERNPSIPREEELDSFKGEYEVETKSGKVFNSRNVDVPEKLKAERENFKEEIEKVKELDNRIAENKRKQQSTQSSGNEQQQASESENTQQGSENRPPEPNNNPPGSNNNNPPESNNNRPPDPENRPPEPNNPPESESENNEFNPPNLDNDGSKPSDSELSNAFDDMFIEMQLDDEEDLDDDDDDDK